MQSPVGLLAIRGNDKGIGAIEYIEKEVEVSPEPPAFLLECVRQLEEYFEGKRSAFHELPLLMRGTEFQLRVWDALLGVPFGETTTYGTLASEVGDKNAARAVGTALNRNPLAIIVPCHRIVASGNDGGYAGGMERKRWLLAHESRDLPSFSKK